MNLDVKDIKPLLLKVLFKLKQNAVFIFIILGLAIFGFLVLEIRTLASLEPSEEILEEKAGENRPVVIDEDSVETIKNLQEVNVEVKALFEQGRTNPFQD